MRRLGIFSFYDKDGVVDTYIEYMIADLLKVLSTLIVVINGFINNESLFILKKYAYKIVIRENKGFDAGAYRNVLVDILGEEKIKEWDEVVLCNDTFYGPFISFEDIFREMEEKKLDFWGLDYREGGFLSFLQSYFLVFRKPIVMNGDLYKYLEANINSDNKELTDIYALFEVGLFSKLVRCGYEFGSYTYTENYNVYLNGDRCLEEHQLPILKKKCFSSQYYSREPMTRALHYIQKNFDYNIKHILTNINRLYGITICMEDIFNCTYSTNKSPKKKIPNLIVDERVLLNFIQQFSEIYIYGTGIIARKIWYLFHMYMPHLKGFLVSKGKEISKGNLYGYPILYYEDIKQDSAIILGLGFENTKEVITTLRPEDRILALWEGLEKYREIIINNSNFPH